MVETKEDKVAKQQAAREQECIDKGIPIQSAPVPPVPVEEQREASNVNVAEPQEKKEEAKELRAEARELEKEAKTEEKRDSKKRK